jgi:eukaryotic-like serine/threonine-protein kinase
MNSGNFPNKRELGNALLSKQATDDQDELDSQLALLLADLTDRMQRGEQVDFAKVCKDHPQFAEDLQMLWGTAQVVHAVGGSRSQADSPPLSEFDSGFNKLTLPAQFGEYVLIEEIGRGGMGIVFRANQPRLNRDVAIKMILKDRLASETDRQRFKAEAEATARLEHPGIVPVYEVGEMDGLPYFTMQLIRGETLGSKIVNGPLPQRQVCRMLIDVCRAVQFAHDHGILHRDIKPSNILIDEQDRVRLSDFGLAKMSGHAESLTHTGVVVGTPSYMSPEQASGRVKLGPATDIYSIGAVLYHALTGQPPFTAKSPVELALKVLEQDPVAPRVLSPRIDRDLEMITVRCLQKPPDLRYSTAAALADDLEAFMRDEPVMARSGQFAQVIARFFRETHHAPVLENWGLLWMWHSLILLIACVLTEMIQWSGTHQRWPYAALWTVGLSAWAIVFWMLRRRMGPVTFVERQIAHVWGASLIAIILLTPLEWWLELEPLTLSPLLAIISGMVFLIKAGILSGVFYFQATALFASTIPMAVFPQVSHLIFGVVAAICFFVPGLKYYRQRNRQLL